MSSLNGNGSARSHGPSVEAAAARRFAEALVVGFDACEQEDMRLSQLQKIALIESALLQFDGFEADLHALAAVSEMLHALGRRRRSD